MTTLFYDRSKYDGTAWVPDGPTIIRAGEGSFEVDPLYASNRAKMAAAEFPYLPYWFLTQDPIIEQVNLAAQTIGDDQAIMLDMERDGTRTPTLAGAIDFADEWAGRTGGKVTDLYLPHWYWQAIGSPDLVPFLIQRYSYGIALHSSNYTTYTDTGPGWDPYGGVTPTFWQYQAGPDRSAYKGTTPIEQIWKEGTMTAPTPDPTTQDIFAVLAAIAAGADRATRHGSPLNMDLRPMWTRIGKEAAAAVKADPPGGSAGPITFAFTGTATEQPPAVTP